MYLMWGFDAIMAFLEFYLLRTLFGNYLLLVHGNIIDFV